MPGRKLQKTTTHNHNTMYTVDWRLTYDCPSFSQYNKVYVQHGRTGHTPHKGRTWLHSAQTMSPVINASNESRNAEFMRTQRQAQRRIANQPLRLVAIKLASSHQITH